MEYYYSFLNENKENNNNNNKVSCYPPETTNVKPMAQTVPAEPLEISQRDFKRTTLVGKGCFGKVFQVVHNNKVYAMKVIKKTEDDFGKIQLKVEEYVLKNIKSVFLCHLFHSFETQEQIYFVLDFLHGGDFHALIESEHIFNEDTAMFYISQVLLALEHLHENEIIHRDLKPSNIMIDRRGYIKLTDFGLCKLSHSIGEKTWTFCGTPMYYAPELIRWHGYDQSVDLWALGVMMHRMVLGRIPFQGDTKDELFKEIVEKDLMIPRWASRNVKMLLMGLLTKDPKNRISIFEAKGLDFFRGLDWVLMENQRYEAPLKPRIEDDLDVSNFNRFFTDQEVLYSQVEGDPFKGFDYNA